MEMRFRTREPIIYARNNKEAKKELHLIDNMLKSFSVTGLTDVYTDLNKYRKALIKPLVETDEMYAKRWEQEAYVGKGFTEKDPEYYTRRGESVSGFYYTQNKNKTSLLLRALWNAE